MRKLLENTLADCMRFVHPRKYEVDVDNYHFEITSKENVVSLNIYLDYGFGGSHFYELVKKGAKNSEVPNLEMDFFARGVLELIESYPKEHPLDREQLYEKYEARMEKEYRNLLGLSYEISDLSDLYELLINETDSRTYRLVSPKTECAVRLLQCSNNLGYDLNCEHLERLGIVLPGDYIPSFWDEHKDECIFGDVGASYCKALDTEAHPIPWLLYVTFNGARKKKWDYDFEERYTRVLNYLAVKENRALFQSLTPEVIATARKENEPIVFHLTTDEYYDDPFTNYWTYHEYSLKIPEISDFDETLRAIKTKLIEHELI